MFYQREEPQNEMEVEKGGGVVLGAGGADKGE